MKIYDILQEIFGCSVYPGDNMPSIYKDKCIATGDAYNLTSFSMCAHNGTHIDAPFHFIDGGKTVEQIPLEKLIGECYVACFNGVMKDNDAQNIIISARATDIRSAARILIKGKVLITPEAADVFAKENIYLIGVESQSVGDEEKPKQVHMILLQKEIVLLEGIRLGEVDDGVYFLCAAPLSLGGCDGSPCRAILIKP